MASIILGGQNEASPVFKKMLFILFFRDKAGQVV
jgi:hypothetical protein